MLHTRKTGKNRVLAKTLGGVFLCQLIITLGISTTHAATTENSSVPASVTSNVNEEVSPNNSITNNSITNETIIDESITSEPFTVPDYDILSLSDEIKTLLDTEVAYLKSKKQRFDRLHELFYKPHYLNLVYSPHGTYSASETFRKGKGNCVSHANLFVAAARYLNLNAYYQTVEVPLEWRPRAGFYELPGHINVVVKLGRLTATVEFDSTIFADYDISSLKSEVISDTQAKAEFYNNLGVEELANGDFQKSVAYFDKAIETDKKLDISWSNMGVAYKHLKEYEKAEQAYLKALDLDPENKSAMKNLYVLYTDLGKKTLSAQYKKRVERYARKNPYYLEKLANRELSLKNYSEAQSLFKKAIRIYDLEPSFYHGLAVSFYHQNDIEGAKKALTKAQELSSDESKKARYSRKLKVLASH